MRDAILGAAIGGFLAWTLGHFAALYLRRLRLIAYLEVCLGNHFENIRGNQKWLWRVEATTLQVGQTVKSAPLYTSDELDDLTSVREQSLELLRRRELRRLTQAHRGIWEIEALFRGFCSTLREHQASGLPLTADDVDHLRSRARRINAFVNQLPKETVAIGLLPEAFPECIGPETLVQDQGSVLDA